MTGDRVVFMMSKDPVRDSGGDVAVSNLIMELARDDFHVRCVCLSTYPDAAPDPGIVRVPKPPVSALRLAAAGIRARRSLVHTRFDVPELTVALDRTDADVFVAEHSYMAESFLASDRYGQTRLVVNTHVPESLVFGETRGLLGRFEQPRIVRDELRVAHAADTVGTFDEAEAHWYRNAGVDDARWLALTSAPHRRIDIADTGPRLVFLGDRTWPPNAEAYDILLTLWPRIAAATPGAELVVAGKSVVRQHHRTIPDGVREVGFVPDLEALLSTCRGMIAPIRTGGGVRVKLLEAAARGLPFVGTEAAWGAHAGIFESVAARSVDELVEDARRLLADPAHAVARGRRLHEITAQRWSDRVPHELVRSWLAGAVDETEAPA
ncbi:MAG: glycosyltransferase family 4 protein [Rhodococcus sp. (in: high G+C Gram-positive bacteria)]|uniref:glycosyltransferase family 4 protein n=1 Tax=Rhodococcus sp. TaxID=1831 RepID=UPI003BB75418